MSSRRPVASSPPSAGARGLRDVLGLATGVPFRLFGKRAVKPDRTLTASPPQHSDDDYSNTVDEFLKILEKREDERLEEMNGLARELSETYGSVTVRVPSTDTVTRRFVIESAMNAMRSANSEAPPNDIVRVVLSATTFYFVNPAAVNTIEPSAFDGWLNLTTIGLGQCTNLHTIGRNAFAHLEKLADVTFPASLQSIGNGAFYGCTMIKSFNLRHCSQLTSIGNSVFSKCSALASVILPASLESLGVLVFCKCSSLEHVDLSALKKLNTIDSRAFEACTRLASVGLPPKLETIRDGAFNQCVDLKTTEREVLDKKGQQLSLKMPDFLKTIGDDAFKGCTSLQKVDFSACESVRLEDRAFEGCTSLEKVDLSKIKALQIGDHVFRDCDNLKLTVSEFQRNRCKDHRGLDVGPEGYKYDRMGMPDTATLTIVSEGAPNATVEYL
jgi:hypothetical protein